MRKAAVSVTDLFEVSDSDTVWDAWLTAVNLLDMLENTHRIGKYYDFAQARDKIAKLCAIAEVHSIDRNIPCKCGLSDGEHSLLRRKMMTFFKLQVANLKHFVY
ncbi:MAG: hypothetical protein AUH37_03005 [Candidatus Nitrososphaera sp. 13_1_40CM_48_12]|nr:MAG: hypothetical protein AUH37_03005 [Candidatus Nitrososphaera sp. 13_1_40CM_48_12]